MKRTQKASWFVAGLLVAVIVSALISPALAALTGKTITVYSGIQIYLDDQKLNPTDVNGKTVDVFAYNGTTYLPVRAVSSALDIPVQYDAKTQSVYLGRHSSNAPAIMLSDLDYFTKIPSASLAFQYLDTLQDNLGNTQRNVIVNTYDDDCISTYLINGQYSRLTGTFFQSYEYRSSNYVTKLTITGDGKELYSASMSGGVTPIDFSVDLTGVLELQVTLTGTGSINRIGNKHAGLGNCGLWS